MVEITLYTVENCPRCEKVRNEITYKPIQIKNMSDPEILTDLRCRGVFTVSAPILQIDDNFYSSELFNADNLNIELLSKILSKAMRDDVIIACGRGWNRGCDRCEVSVDSLKM